MLPVRMSCARPFSEAARILNPMRKVWQERDLKEILKVVVTNPPPDIHCVEAGRRVLPRRPPLGLGAAKHDSDPTEFPEDGGDDRLFDEPRTRLDSALFRPKSTAVRPLARFSSFV